MLGTHLLGHENNVIEVSSENHNSEQSRQGQVKQNPGNQPESLNMPALQPQTTERRNTSIHNPTSMFNYSYIHIRTHSHISTLLINNVASYGPSITCIYPLQRSLHSCVFQFVGV